MVFGNGVKNIQATAYNGARTVYTIMVRFLMKQTLQTTYTKSLHYKNDANINFAKASVLKVKESV